MTLSGDFNKKEVCTFKAVYFLSISQTALIKRFFLGVSSYTFLLKM